MITPGEETEIAKLLQDSYFAGQGADIAREVGDRAAATRLKDKAASLYKQADAMDPDRHAQAWED